MSTWLPTITAALAVVATLLAAGTAASKELRERRAATTLRPKRQGWWRLVRWISLPAIVMIVALGVLATRTGPFPTAQEDTLMALVPRELFPTCRRARDAPPKAIAHIQCGPMRPLEEVRYALFSKQADLNTHYDARLGGLGLPPGRCNQQRRANADWQKDGEPGGQILCYQESTRSIIEWTTNDLGVYAYAKGFDTNSGALQRWWVTFGPARSYEDRLPYPDVKEGELLDHVPPAFRTKCRRAADPAENASAGVDCRPGKGADVATYFWFNTEAELDAYYKERLQYLDLPPTFCTRGGRRTHDGEDQYKGGSYDGGRRLCYVSSGEGAHIEWTDTYLGIYGKADRADARLDRLYSWWLNKSGPE